MAVDFDAWLQKPSAHRVLLAEIAATASDDALYFASESFNTSAAAATLANTHFDGRLVGDPTFTRELGGVFFGGRRTTSGFSPLEVTNQDGGLNPNLREDWDGRQITLKLGDASWDYDDFETIMTGVCGSIEARADGVILIPVRDLSRDLDLPLPAERYTTGDSNGELVPIALGDLANVEPRLISAANLDYEVENSAVTISEVYDNGVALSGSPNGWTDLGNGRFRLTSNPAGRVTVDCTGIKDTQSPPVQISTIGQILKYLLTEYPLVDGAPILSASDIVQSELDDLDTYAPYTVGLYLRNETRLPAVLDALLASAGGYWYMGRDGKFHVGVVDPLGVTPSVIHRLSDIEMSGDFESRIAGRKHDVTRLGYRVNWTVQDGDALAGSVGESRKEQLAKEHIVLESGTRTADGYVPEAINTLITDAADAATELSHWRTRLSSQQWFYTTEAFAEPQDWELGDTIQISSEAGVAGAIGPINDHLGGKLIDSFGEPILSSNRLLLAGVREHLLTGRVTLTMWGN